VVARHGIWHLGGTGEREPLVVHLLHGGVGGCGVDSVE